MKNKTIVKRQYFLTILCLLSIQLLWAQATKVGISPMFSFDFYKVDPAIEDQFSEELGLTPQLGLTVEYTLENNIGVVLNVAYSKAFRRYKRVWNSTNILNTEYVSRSIDGLNLGIVGGYHHDWFKIGIGVLFQRPFETREYDSYKRTQFQNGADFSTPTEYNLLHKDTYAFFSVLIQLTVVENTDLVFSFLQNKKSDRYTSLIARHRLGIGVNHYLFY